MATVFQIHPSIGIARVGASTETFLGPEIPGVTPVGADGKYRDSGQKLRRQAARFWVFAHDSTNPAAPPKPVVIGQDDVKDIEWTVHLVNKKASWFTFSGTTGEGPGGYPAGHLLRNSDITDPAERQKKLVIDPGPRTVNGATLTAEFSKGTGGGFHETWPGTLLPHSITTLGGLKRDTQGRVEVAGGLGIAGTSGVLPNSGALDFVNNNGWFDDASDGPVTARLVMKNGQKIDVQVPAWVIVGPFDFAPAVENIVSMYDGVTMMRSGRKSLMSCNCLSV